MSTDPVVTAERVEMPNAELRLTVPHDLVYFDGHFPGSPIVPGVVQIKWAIELARRCLGIDGTFAGMDALKFQQVMLPGVSVTLSLRWAAPDGKLNFSYQGDSVRYGSGRVRFRRAP